MLVKKIKKIGERKRGKGEGPLNQVKEKSWGDWGLIKNGRGR